MWVLTSSDEHGWMLWTALQSPDENSVKQWGLGNPRGLQSYLKGSANHCLPASLLLSPFAYLRECDNHLLFPSACTRWAAEECGVEERTAGDLSAERGDHEGCPESSVEASSMVRICRGPVPAYRKPCLPHSLVRALGGSVKNLKLGRDPQNKKCQKPLVWRPGFCVCVTVL